MKFNIIYCDPPWSYKNYNYATTKSGTRAKRGVVKEYPTMTVAELCQLKVADLAADDCLLAMWWVPPLPNEALEVVKAWGFEFKTMKGFCWRKLTVNGKEHFGMGNYTRANSEDCLFAVKGKPVRINAGVRSVINSPVGKHSKKPDEARDRLVQLMGDVPRVELFARTVTPGWATWGNEVPNDISL